MDKNNPLCGYPPDPWLSGLSHLCYTDGSLYGDFESGAGFAIFQNKTSKRMGYDGRVEMQVNETALYDTYRSYYLLSTPIC